MLVQKPLQLFILLSVRLLASVKLSVATKKDARMWFLPSKPHALDTRGHTLDPKNLSVVPADWSEDFQLALNCV